CRKKCRGDVFKIAEKYFHKECFKCKICNKRLDTGGFFMRDNSFYCQKDYSLYFSTKCKICQKEVDNEVVSALNETFHRTCFKCESCKLSFKPGDQVSLIANYYYCSKCSKKVQMCTRSKTSFFSKEGLKQRLFRASSADVRAKSNNNVAQSQQPDPEAVYSFNRNKDALTIDPNLGSDQENVSPILQNASTLSKTLDSGSLHLYQSYLHLNECRSPNPHDLYKRIPSLGTLPSETAYRPRQFHIPESESSHARITESRGR
ncbi:hypothetical protein Ciccas_014104, partial [Cichlidogyrus casuarinus]